MTKSRRNRKGYAASRLLVVDASVLCSAGEEGKPVAAACSRALTEIYKICHRVVLTKEIQDEWSRHESAKGRKWLCYMHGRKGKLVKLDASKWEPNRNGLARLTSGVRAAIEKDARLVGAACAADGIVVTCDSNFVKHMTLHGDDLGVPRPLRWIDPVKEPDAIGKL